MSNRDKLMIKYLIMLFFIAALFSCTKHKNRIIERTTDDRGLTSVIFVTPQNDTFGLDYLTTSELDSLINR